MTEVKVPDDGGDTLTLIEHNGYLFPQFDVRAITGLSSVKIREDDVMLVTFPKSGTHWVWEITRQILSGRILEDDTNMTSMLMEYTTEEGYASAQAPRVLCSHTLPQQLPPDLIKKKPKLVTCLRNPKDVAASFYTFVRKLPYMEYNGQWNNLIQPFFRGKFAYGSWMDHVLTWEKVKVDYPDWPILTLYYEDFVEDTVGEIRKLCRFLEVERSEEYMEKVCKQCSFDTMKKLKSISEIKSMSFRKGHVGDWKNWFTVAQNEWFDQLYQEKMKDCRLTFRYTLDN